MGEAVIETRGLRKSYGEIEALAGVDLRIERGEVFALLGPNGAGKTTAVEILEGHRKRDGGDATVLGYDPGENPRDLRRRIGIVLQTTGVERYLRVEEVIELYRGYYDRPRPLDEVIEVVGLQDQRSSLVRQLSGGQQRRLDVAIGVAGDPELLFLDEPTTGFDPSARRQAWKMIENLRSLGKTILLTTHYMDEAQQLAGRVAIIVSGRIVAEGTPAELMAAGGVTRISFRQPAVELPAAFRGAAIANGRVAIETPEPTKALHELAGWAVGAGVELEDLSVAQQSLEDIYLRLTGDGEDAAGA